jgi:alpha-tubulin suppressor-like RCC1 family protein
VVPGAGLEKWTFGVKIMRSKIASNIGRVASMLCLLTGQASSASIPLLGAQQIGAGAYTTCAVVNGAVQCWGANILAEAAFNGMLYSYFYLSSSPVILPELGGVSKVTVGSEHFCALINGAAKCWGYGDYGSTGPNGASGGSGPVSVPGATSGVTDVSAGGLNTCAIVNQGAICWGDNYFGQLGNSTVASGDYGDYSSTPVAVIGLETNVKKIVVGTTGFPSEGFSGHVCAVVGNIAECWGDNSHGQLGRDTIPATSYDDTAGQVSSLGSGVTDIATGDDHSCAVVNGAAYCWGSNYAGELGSNSVPVGLFSYSQTPVAVQGLQTGVVAIAASSNHSCALVNNDAVHPVKCWGSNGFGELGNGTAASSPVPVNAAFFPALTASNQVTSIATGGQHTCAVIVTSGVARTYCWGDNEAGQLGKSDAPVFNPAPQTVVGPSSNITAIASGTDNWHGCAVVNGGAQCWGSNNSGQLGDGLNVDRSIALGVSGLDMDVSQIAAGGNFNCAIVANAAKCWGGGSGGVLGNNSQASQKTPVQVSGLATNVSKIAASGGQIPIVSSGGAASFGGHVCAVVSGGVQCWGENTYGELGNASVATGSGAYSPVPVAVTGISGATDVVVTAGTSCATVNTGVLCWGQRVGNTMYASGSTTPVGPTGLASGVTALAAGHAHLCALQNGVVRCWGENSQGQLGNNDSSGIPSVEPVSVPGLSNATLIAAGGSHTCAVDAGVAKCWGSNINAELGIGTVGGRRLLPAAVKGLDNGIVALAAGTSHTCALLGSSSIKCWGSDFNGQLGDGRYLSAETPQLVNLGETIFSNGFDL